MAINIRREDFLQNREKQEIPGSRRRCAVSYIETAENHRFPWYVRLLFRLQRRRDGREPEPARLWGRDDER